MNLEVINEIRTTIASLQQQLNSLDSRLRELSEEAAAPAAVEPEPDFTPETPASPEESLTEEETAMPFEPSVDDLPELAGEDMVIDIPEELAPVEESVPEEAVPVEEIPAEAVPVVEEMVPAEETPQSPAQEAPAKIFTKEYRWLEDMPGGPVGNIISAISLNDRVLFINTLFGKDPMLFNTTIADLNALESLDVARTYLTDRFPDWDFDSEVVYRIMMAIRRKLK